MLLSNSTLQITLWDFYCFVPSTLQCGSSSVLSSIHPYMIAFTRYAILCHCWKYFYIFFRNSTFGFGTRQTHFTLIVLLQKWRDQLEDVLAYFINNEKAFDRVQNLQIIKALEKTDVYIKKNGFPIDNPRYSTWLSL